MCLRKASEVISLQLGIRYCLFLNISSLVSLVHYPHDTRFLDLCDELGIMVWQENLGWGNSESQLTNKDFIKALLQVRANFKFFRYLYFVCRLCGTIPFLFFFPKSVMFQPFARCYEKSGAKFQSLLSFIFAFIIFSFSCFFFSLISFASLSCRTSLCRPFFLLRFLP